MIDIRLIDEITRRLGDALPPGVSQAKEELENQFRTVLTGAFERMNLVGRQEYEARCAELEALQEKLAALEARLDEIS
ncbi:MAG: accessory factor UbiK family protein [Xanthomonadales bacterium]|jgi:BMFP domain-containing protein YqiC|nr:accessory factor UbiK family protein [Xanthomonadales bacterium]MDH3926292.1 accessory factor UbiK family protein [Xanthomonadales bacterium]MDH4000494.1 accessory factor UbiK family protein [Xanthomonadales bacterium]